MVKPDAEGIEPIGMSGVMPPASIIGLCTFSIKVKCLRLYRSPALQGNDGKAFVAHMYH